MGRNGIDNGWIQFTHFRIPRTSLLMRYTKVLRNGQVIQSPLAQLSFGALVFARTMMIKENTDFAKKALIIALRYSCVRRQFSDGKEGEETRLMDYKTHQYRLIPLLATVFAMHFTAMESFRVYDNLMEVLSVAKPGDSKMQEAVDALKECHGTSAGVKAHTGYNTLHLNIYRWLTADIIDQCRQACGGHGYSSYAGLAGLYQDFVVQNTWEVLIHV
jgi:acyl-CoA oxidase